MIAKYELPDFLLCVDPGKMTGMALYQCIDGDVTLIWSAEVEYNDAGNTVNKTMLEYGTRLRVVCESFIITPMTAKNSVAPWSLELIGVVKYLAHAYGLAEPILQTPAKAKNFCPNDRLRALGFWHRGGAGHARDALRHGVTHLVDCGWHHENLLQ